MKYSGFAVFSALITLYTTLIAVNYRAKAGQMQEPSYSDIARMDSIQLDLSELILNRFKKDQEKWKCFTATISSSEEGNIRIDFIPKDNLKIDGNNIIVNASECGHGVSYIIDKFGKLINIVYSR